MPLAEAWRSGASSWTTSRRQSFANDLSRPQLIAVTDNVNQSKGDQDPSTWQPSRTAYRCTYAKMWIASKYYWGLRLQSSEKIGAADHAQHLHLLIPDATRRPRSGPRVALPTRWPVTSADRPPKGVPVIDELPLAAAFDWDSFPAGQQAQLELVPDMIRDALRVLEDLLDAMNHALTFTLEEGPLTENDVAASVGALLPNDCWVGAMHETKHQASPLMGQPLHMDSGSSAKRALRGRVRGRQCARLHQDLRG